VGSQSPLGRLIVFTKKQVKSWEADRAPATRCSFYFSEAWTASSVLRERKKKDDLASISTVCHPGYLTGSPLSRYGDVIGDKTGLGSCLFNITLFLACDLADRRANFWARLTMHMCSLQS
jgi:hypothetical protein